MAWLSKNWWILALLAIAAVVVYFILKEDEIILPPVTTTNCTGFGPAIAEMEANVDATAAWKAQIEGRMDAGEVCVGKTYEECRRSESIWMLKEQGKIPWTCNP